MVYRVELCCPSVVVASLKTNHFVMVHITDILSMRLLLLSFPLKRFNGLVAAMLLCNFTAAKANIIAWFL